MAKPNFTRSKPFRAFVEGNTISDGRTITSAMIDEIAGSFSAETYTPRINVEHIAGYSPEPPFNGYGNVVAVTAQTDDIVIAGKTEKRRALYCTVDGNEQLVKLATSDQKPFPSVEITPSYAGTGKFGLVGLAFTDNPASIATQRLTFSSVVPGSVRVAGEDAVAFGFAAAPELDTSKADGAIAGFFKALTDKFSGGEKPKEEPKVEEKPKPANDNDLGAFATAIGETVAQSIAAAIEPISDAHTTLANDFAALKQQVEQTEKPGQFRRQPADGGGKLASQVDF